MKYDFNSINLNIESGFHKYFGKSKKTVHFKQLLKPRQNLANVFGWDVGVGSRKSRIKETSCRKNTTHTFICIICNSQSRENVDNFEYWGSNNHIFQALDWIKKHNIHFAPKVIFFNVKNCFLPFMSFIRIIISKAALGRQCSDSEETYAQ